MAKKYISWKTKGMNRDTSVSAFNPEFAFENVNLRLATNEGNTMMSWVNEKGPAQISLKIKNYNKSETYNSIKGTPIGTAILNHQLVIFTTDKGTLIFSDIPDRIYVFKFSNQEKTEIEGRLLFEGNLNFSVNYPLETLVAYEAKNIQKVYWTDTKNQPRLINIAATDSKIYKWNENPEARSYFFDFVPAFEMKESDVTITKNVSSGGLFAPGVIQYAFTYINTYGQESNIAYLSTLYYLSLNDRAASPEEKVTSSFKIGINNPDYNFDYIRLYSIQRTSINADPFVKRLDDIPITKSVKKNSDFNNISLQEGSTEVTKNYTYSDDARTFLPREIVNGELGRKIQKMSLSRGSYVVNITPYEFAAKAGYAPGDRFTLNGYDNSTNKVGGAFNDLQTIINIVANPKNNYQEYKFEEYYAKFRLSQDWDIICSNITAAEGYDSWALCMGQDVIPANSIINESLELIYDFSSERWYIIYGEKGITVKETIDEVTTPDVPSTPETPDDTDRNDEEEFDIIYVDNGTAGTTIDPMELLYVGGMEITALTMADKDNTLFLGNISQKNSSVSSIQNYFDNLRDKNPNNHIVHFETNNRKILTLNNAIGVYSHTNTLNHNLREITTFKGNETYRFGFQLQKKTGEWSAPIFIEDVTNDKYPYTQINNPNVNLVYAQGTLPIDYLEYEYNKNIKDDEKKFYSIYKAIRPVIVYPNISDRNVLCQGVVNPTVFNIEDRPGNSPFAQASWFFRPYVTETKGDTPEEDTPVYDDLKIEVNEDIPDDDVDEQIENSLDDYLKNNGYLRSVYVLVADVEEAQLNTILSRGAITYHRHVEERYITGVDGDDRELDRDDNDYPQEFDWAIDLGNNKYAFINLNPFKKPGTTKWNDGYKAGSEEIEYIDGISNVRVDPMDTDGTTFNKKFKFYSKMKKTSKNLCYYTLTNASAPNPYVFMFDVFGELYTVEFTSLRDEFNHIQSSNAGNALRFKHYESLPTIDSLKTIVDVTEYKNKAKELEIEGAGATYISPYKKETFPSKSNNQFFIDQSIVTLNSPDIEFDTEVQTYGTEGLKLRIVGAIPITANVSAHSIKISSSMLERNHNIDSDSHGFGEGEKPTIISHDNITLNGGKRLISDYFWNDVIVNQNLKKPDGVTTEYYSDFLVYPWQRTGSMNNDTRVKESTDKDGNKISASSYLQTKKESHLLYSYNSGYFTAGNNGETNLEFEDLSAQIHLTENDEVRNMRLPKQKEGVSEINYYPNIDKVLTNETGYKVLADEGKETLENWATINNPVSMKYKSTSHAIIAMNAYGDSTIPIMPYAIVGSDGEKVGEYSDLSGGTFKTYWGDYLNFSQKGKNLNNVFSGNKFDFLWLAELYKDVDPSSRFGGKTSTAVAANTWQVCGETIPLNADTGDKVTLYWTEGDTYYQRYDCLKTYPFTNEDINQNTEILSFMCETHVNIDGRYDKNRGQMKNYTMRPENFNKLNPVYSQQNNFFTYRKMDNNIDISELSYPNHIYYTKTKESGADIDLWTNVTLTSTLELDGDKGEITSLNRFNDQLIAFQDSGISQILYNENVQITSTAGVPIEIANSGKVQGKRYLSDTIGCSNKWSITQTPSGLYFIDNNDKSIYLFNGKLNNLSASGGFNSWSKQNIPSADNYHKWNPVNFNNFRTVYDKLNNDVLFINKDIALAYSEKFECFTSFYSYGNSPYLETLDDTAIWVRNKKLWKHQAGDYCKFFDKNKPFSMTLVGNQEPQMDKIFTNLEFRACVEGEGTYDSTKDTFVPTLPFDSLEVWDEYQHGILTLNNKNANDRFTHGKDNGILARKFRMWRCDIPRDNAPVNEATETPMGIKRFKARPLDRIRNPWAYIKITKNAATNSTLHKVQIHDIVATYFS